MFYVSDARFGWEVKDSETGEVFRVQYKYGKYYNGFNVFPMQEVLGYFGNNSIRVVPDELPVLLNYIVSVGLTDESHECVSVSRYPIVAMDRYSVLYTVSRVGISLDVLDVVLIMSRSDKFWEIFKRTGVVTAEFGVGQYLRIQFCDDCQAVLTKFLSKLTTLKYNVTIQSLAARLMR